MARAPRNGIAAPQRDVPTKWSDQENVVWRAAILGRGHSSPIMVKDRILLTTADTAKQAHFVLVLIGRRAICSGRKR